MERYLVTQSLLSSWARVFDVYEGGEAEAMDEFIATLRREPREPSDAMRRGIEFETAVYAQMHHQPRRRIDEWEEGIMKVAGYIGDAPTQVKAQRDIEVDGMNFLVYGILDALKAGVILDVKFTSRKFGGLELAGKYLDSPQHSAYFYIVPEAHQFQYLVSDGEDMYIETYCRDDSPPISEYIHNFITSVTQMGLLDVYREKWKAYES